MMRYEGVETDNGTYRGAVWTWYNSAARAVRTEADTNADGVPDEMSRVAFHKSGPRRPLAVEQSWAVWPDLVPPGCRIPDQPGRRVPVRRIQ